jgi:hypothetical protein
VSPLYPSDIDDLRKSITEAAALVAAAIVFAGSPRMEADIDESVDVVKDLLDEIRERA